MSKITVIAEMAYSHDGDPRLAEQIVRDAAAAGADAISIHITHMPDYMVPHYGSGPGRLSAGKETRGIFDYLCEISLSFDAWRAVAGVARDLGLDLVIMPNDAASLAFSQTLDPAALVVPPACFEDYEFIDAVGRVGKPVYVRVGGATLGEIEVVLGRLSAVGNERITLLYGHQNYPTRIDDTNLAMLTRLRETFGFPVGLADHLDADDPFATILPLVAAALGVVCIEKHMTHDRAKRGEDFESALNRDEMRQMIERLRLTERALGGGRAAALDESSIRYRNTVRKRLVAARDIKAGEVIEGDAMIAKRADEGLSPAAKASLLGAVAGADIPRDAGIDWSLLTARPR